MEQNKWQIHRAGVLNFWYYDEEEFHFANGKLLLRGSNGSGKSVTMQSLIPILLDGKKSPDRLDPFGSRARKMEDYLLGEKEIVDRDERTGYLYIEYKRSKTDQYITTGIGLRAKRQGNLEFWGFVIHDNRRIGHDFQLYKTEYSAEKGEEQKIPLARRELENRLEQGGTVVHTQGDYMELVNKYVFGFESIDAYDELIKLLIQLRSPKLSKDFKPTVIYDILNNALPALSDDELRPLSDTIEHMDQTKQQLDQLIRDHQALTKLCKHYDAYNQYVLAEKANGFLQTQRKENQLQRKHEELQSLLDQQQQQKIALKDELEALRQEQNVLKEEEQQLRDHDVFEAEERKNGISQKLQDTHAKIMQKQQSVDQKRGSERELHARLIKAEEKKDATEGEMNELLETMESDAYDSGFANHELAASEFKRTYPTGFQFKLWKNESRDYHQHLEDILKKLREQTNARTRFQDLDQELGEARKQFDLKRNEEHKWKQLFEEERRAFLEMLHRWRYNNAVFVISDEDIQLTAQRAIQMCETYRIDQIKEPITETYQLQYQNINGQIATQRHHMNLKQEEIEKKRVELQEWKAKKDPEPERHMDTIQARKQLEKSGISFLPLFAAVEFHENVAQEQRERIESAISEMGLLDALIIPERFRSQAIQSDRILKSNPQMLTHTLADVLYPTPVEGIAVTGEEIMDVLNSIVIGDFSDSNTSINEEGSYQIGLLHGHANDHPSIYIGKESRRQYRIQQIERLQSELNILEEQKNQLIEKSHTIQEQERQLKIEFDAFPKHQQVLEAYEFLEQVKRDVKSLSNDVDRKNEAVKKAAALLQQIKNDLLELTRSMNLDSTEDTYESAKQWMRDYMDSLQQLELLYKDFLNYRDQIKQLEINLENVKLDVDELNGELNSLHSAEDQLKLSLKRIDELLQQLGADEIRLRIAQVLARLEALPREIESFSNDHVTKGIEIRTTEKDIAEHEQERNIMNRLYQLWMQVFIDDDRLQFIHKTNDTACWSDEEQTIHRAKFIKREYSTLLSSSNMDREKMTNRITQSFFDAQGVLVEYRLTQDFVMEVTDVPAEDHETYYYLHEELKQKSRRVQILLEYQGKRVSPYFVLEQLDKEIELQNNYLNAKDRELFEEIIMNSVGRMIRTRIQRAEHWVEKINRLMDERDTSSGLNFSIRWKPRTAELEDEMDTKDLVELLRSDARLLKDQDFQKVTRHFRSKISRAKEVVEGKAYGETLHQVIKEMLDYRQWFSFTLYYRREGEQRKELTNNVFFTFSGGEKAMAMYIPLFCAAYSRYLEARKDAPFIISLDEAFAGVDENNIRDMFDLVEKLGFNYIMNSQAIWGDYDTVSSLSICELVRPKNAPFVTVVRYRWDGKARYLLHQLEAAATLAEGEHGGEIHV
jgi:uncharacterized protein (TIGR02680 family)